MLNIGILLGDDIGLEVVPEAVKVMRAASRLIAKAKFAPFRWRRCWPNIGDNPVSSPPRDPNDTLLAYIRRLRIISR